MCIAHMNGLLQFYMPGIQVGTQSVQAWRCIIATGANVQENQELELIAFDVVSNARLAVPSQRVKTEITCCESQLLTAAARGEDAVDEQTLHAEKLRTLAETELSRLEADMKATWDAYSLLTFRCSAVRRIKTDFMPLQQPVPGGMTDDTYLAWLYE